jgi:hypothetical protein
MSVLAPADLVIGVWHWPARQHPTVSVPAHDRGPSSLAGVFGKSV